MPSPARRVGQNPQPQCDGGQGEQDVDKGQPQDHLHDDVEDEEAVDEVEDGEQQGHAHAPGVNGGHQGAERRAEHVSCGHVQGRCDEAGNGVGDVQDQGAPPQGRCRCHEAEHEAGDHLPPTRLPAAQVLGHDEAEAHPAEDDHQRAGRDGPDDHPRLLDQLVSVGEALGGAGEDVRHQPESPRQLSASSPLARSTTPQSVPWTPSITQPAKALAHRAGLRAERILSHIFPDWWMGTTA